MNRLELLQPLFFDDYLKNQKITLVKHFNKIKKNQIPFGYSIESSAVYSSMIEGNIMDFDTYLKYAHSGMNNKSKSFTEIEDLKNAYLFAKANTITFDNFLESHKIITKTVLENNADYVGVIRNKDVYIFSNGVKLYTGTNPNFVLTETQKLISDINILVERDLTISEVFYYAAYIHLMLAKIHPFADGNGRTARLLEKWFLSKKLGEKAWIIQTEKMYQTNLKKYYTRIHLGATYETLNFNLLVSFLLMLPVALRIK